MGEKPAKKDAKIMGALRHGPTDIDRRVRVTPPMNGARRVQPITDAAKEKEDACSNTDLGEDGWSDSDDDGGGEGAQG